MASRDLNELENTMMLAANMVVEGCKRRGIDLLVYCTYRSLEEQAVEYRESRTLGQIMSKVHVLEQMGYPELGQILKKVGPQQGELGVHSTHAGPGESWHTYREAFDAVALKNGKALWHKNRYRKQWMIYRDECVKAGLTILSWEYPHAQLRHGNNPLKIFTQTQVREKLGL